MTSETAAQTLLDGVVEAAVAERRVVGAQVLVARHGEITHSVTAGYADRETARAFTGDDVFRLASITKPIVTVAVLRLVERGLLVLDEPVTTYLPDFRPSLADGTVPVITLHQLLTHTSGVGYRFFAPAGTGYDAADVSDGLGEPGLALAENLRRITSAPLTFAPGTAWGYSLGIDVIGGVVEAVTGDPLDVVVRREVTGPLGMDDTAFVAAAPARLVTPYFNVPGDDPHRMAEPQLIAGLEGAAAHFSPARALDPTSYPSGGAGMVGTAADLLTFFEAVRTGTLLGPETVALAGADRVGFRSDAEGEGWGFGYGWAVLLDPSATGTPQSPGTLQWGGAYGHKWFVDLARGLTVIGLTNTSYEGMNGRFPLDVRDAVYAGLD